jgi:hypothetical protein
MRLYFKALALAVLLGGTFGLILPFLLSAPSTIAVLGGLIYLLVVFPVAAYWIANSIKKDLYK